MTRIVGVSLVLTALLVVSGCGSSQAGGEPESGPSTAEPAAAAEPAVAVPEDSPAAFAPEGAGIALSSQAPDRGPSLTGNGPDQWILELEVANTGPVPLDGLTYALQLVKGKGDGQVFGVHAGEIHFNPPVAPQARGNWTVRVQVRDGHPEEASAVRLRWTAAERLARELPDEPVWKPLDPNNLPPARTVKLDGKGGVATD